MCLLVLSASKCNKEDDDCHYNIVIKNNSSQSIIFAILISGYGQPVPPPNSPIQCRLDGQEIKPGESYEYRPYNTCIENSMSSSDYEDIFIVDPNNFNDDNVWFSCDSVEYYNTLLKHYILTLDDLKENNFTIIYP